MRIAVPILFVLLAISPLLAQNYTIYHTGNSKDTTTQAQGGICMMGGSSEDDNAMRWFLQRAEGGDILVLRSSGSNGYNNYLYSKLGVKVNSVETIVCNNKNASFESYIHEKMAGAEAIWFAGGDQGEYVRYWRGTPIDSLVRDAISRRNIVVGGTSAGMAIMGKYIYTGRNGSVTSAEALANPYNTRVTIDSARFMDNRFLENVITDTHYDSPDRRGRHITFMARILTDWASESRGIACDEYTAVCIDENGIARVFGEYPTSNDNAYFLRPNCGLSDYTPETCAKGQPLQWLHSKKAVWVYKVKGNKEGSNTFDLNDWITGNGGEWEDWYVDQGVLAMQPTDQVDCTPLETYDNQQSDIRIFPNPTSSLLTLESSGRRISDVFLLDLQGNILKRGNLLDTSIVFDVTELVSGIYFLRIVTEKGIAIRRVVKM